MFRVIAFFAGVFALHATTLLAQNSAVCIFQQKQGRSAEVDAGFDSATLAKELTKQMPSLAANVVQISGFTAKEIEGEAQRRNCAWTVTLSREDLNAATPNFAGNLGGTQASKSTPQDILVKGTKIGGETLLEYSLRKADSHKPVAHGEGDDDSAYAKFAKAIVKNIQKGN